MASQLVVKSQRGTQPTVDEVTVALERVGSGMVAIQCCSWSALRPLATSKAAHVWRGACSPSGAIPARATAGRST
jgi:hypothetical protein